MNEIDWATLEFVELEDSQAVNKSVNHCNIWGNAKRLSNVCVCRRVQEEWPQLAGGCGQSGQRALWPHEDPEEQRVEVALARRHQESHGRGLLLK